MKKLLLTAFALFSINTTYALTVMSTGYYKSRDLSISYTSNPTCLCGDTVALKIIFSYSSDPMTTPVSIDFASYNLLTTDLQGLIDTMNSWSGYFLAVLPCGVYGSNYIKMNGSNALGVHLEEPPILSTTNPSAECPYNTVSITTTAVRSSNVSGSTFLYYQDASCSNLLVNAGSLSSPGTYFIVAKKTYSGTGSCTLSDTGSVIVSFYPSSLLVINNPAPVTQPSTVDITDPSITIGSTNISSLSYWTNNQYNVTLSNPESISVSGTYFIKGESADGCFVYNSNGITVTINDIQTGVYDFKESSNCHNIKYFDTLGRITIPIDGDVVKKTPCGYIIINR